LSQPLIANIHSLKEVKEGGEVDMEEKNQQDRLLGVYRELVLDFPIVFLPFRLLT
jgi:hypothetical protein